MIKAIPTVILVFSVLSLSGCSLADLRTAHILSGQHQSLDRDGRRLLSLAVWRQDKSGRWEDFDEWTIRTRDSWDSGWIRRLTPLTANEQDITFRFRTDRTEAEMTLDNGKKAGVTWGVDKDGQYTVVDGERRYGKVGGLTHYLEPVRDYFFWPQTLVNFRTVLSAGEASLDGQDYHLIFATDGDAAASPETDQYVVWLNKDDLRIEYIEFTLRSLLNSYRGVIRYEEYREVEGMLLPHRLILLDGIDADSYSHEFIVRDMSFSRPVSELGFALDIKPFTLDLGSIQ